MNPSRIILLLISLLLSVDAPAAPRYHLQNLGTLGGNDSAAIALNERGEVTGQSSQRIGGPTHAFRYLNGRMENIGSLATDGNSFGSGINDFGQIVGNFTVNSNQRTFIWESGEMKDLGTLGGITSYGLGINGKGWMTGYSSTSRTFPTHAFLYRDDSMIDIGTLGGSVSYGYSINDFGDIAGSSALTGDTSVQAFLYSNGKMRNLGTLGGSYSNAWAINANKHVTGLSATISNTRPHAFLNTSDGMLDLGTLGGSFSYGYGINNVDQVVGVASTASDDLAGRAFLFDGGTMYDLISLVAPNTAVGWYLYEARDINDKGQIVGMGSFNGQQRAFLLSPIPEVPSLILFIAGIVVFQYMSYTNNGRNPWNVSI